MFYENKRFLNFINISFSTKIAFFIVLYFLTGKFGLGLAAVDVFAAPFWIPTAISLTLLYIGGYKYWPGIFLGAFFVNLLTGAPFFSAFGIAIGNTVEAAIAVYILHRLDFHRSLERVHDVFTLTLIAGPAGAFISATIGLLSLWLAGVVSASNFMVTWSTWWIGDVLSTMIVAPFLLVMSMKFTLNRERLLEGVGLTLIMFLFGTFIFNRPVGSPQIAYMIFPVLLWAGLRFSSRFVIIQIFIFSLLAIWNTSHHVGPFMKTNLSEGLFYLQLYLGVVGVSSLIFSAVMSERNLLEKRKDDFLSMASHELKTPVTSMKIYAGILQTYLKNSKDKKIIRVVSNILGQTDRLKELVSDLLDVSRIDAGKLQFSMEDFNIDELIDEVKNGISLSSDKHKIIYKGKLGVAVYADKFRIYQVLTNLLTNAIRYSPQGGEIVVGLLKEENRVIISIKDQGIGISDDQKDKIFDRLYQAGGLEEKTFPGLGMGLYISKEIIRRHRGAIWVESDKGKGSTFYFSLPAIKTSSAIK